MSPILNMALKNTWFADDVLPSGIHLHRTNAPTVLCESLLHWGVDKFAELQNEIDKPNPKLYSELICGE
jgi:hypothetical protein